MTGIEKLYEQMTEEFKALQNTAYPKYKLNGYEDALWDFKIIAKDVFGMNLPTVQQVNPDNLICRCGHPHIEHLATSSINYTAGRCTKCVCKNFISAPTTSEQVNNSLNAR